jgi:hypothetical protein
MSLLGTLLVLAIACALASGRRLERALATLLAVTILVPDTLALPGPGLQYLPVTRLVLIAFCVGLVRHVHRGDIWYSDLRPTRVQGALACFALVVATTGVALARPELPWAPRLAALALVVEQLVFFSAVLIACRAIGDFRRIARIIAIVAIASVTIALLEYVLHKSFARFVLGGPLQRYGVLGSQPLEPRGGSVRVRAGAQFALAFGWVTTCLVPMLVVVAARTRRRGYYVAAGLAVLMVMASGSRSALPAAVIGVLVLLVAARFQRPFVIVTVVGALFGVAMLFGLPGLAAPYRSTEATGSDRTRTDRLAVVTEAAAARPVTGLGLGAITAQLGSYGADNSYLLMYVEGGVLALAALIATLVTALFSVAAGLRGPPGPDRALSAACLAATALGALGAGAYDLFSVPGSALPFWAVVALGVAVAERAPVTVVAVPRSPARVLWPIGAALVGLVLFAGAPRHTAVTYRFESLPLYRVAYEAGNLDYAGRVLANTGCELARGAADPPVSVRCRVIDQSWGLGELRVSAPNRALAEREGTRITTAVHEVLPGFRAAEKEVSTGRPTLLVTAPVWLALLAAIAALFAPAYPVRRLEAAPRLVPAEAW